MSHPQYANAFSVSYNPNLGELILDFSQEYPVFDHPTISQREQSGITQVGGSPARESICGVAIPRTTALQLLSVLENALGLSAEEVKANE